MVQTKSPPPTRPAHEERRLAILRGAAAVFREKGYHAAGMREIAARVGRKAGALYYYFPSKTDLLYACQEVSLARLLDGGRAIAGTSDPAPARLRALVAHHLAVVLDVVGGSAVHLAYDALPPVRRRALLARRDEYEGLFRDVIRDGVRARRFRMVDAKATTLALLGALNATVLWWRPGGDWTAGGVADEYADLFLRGLAAPGADEDVKEEQRT